MRKGRLDKLTIPQLLKGMYGTRSFPIEFRTLCQEEFNRRTNNKSEMGTKRK